MFGCLPGEVGLSGTLGPGPFGWRLADLDLGRSRVGEFLPAQGDLQAAVFAVGEHLFRIDRLRHRERTGELAVGSLDAMTAGFFGLRAMSRWPLTIRVPFSRRISISARSMPGRSAVMTSCNSSSRMSTVGSQVWATGFASSAACLSESSTSRKGKEKSFQVLNGESL